MTHAPPLYFAAGSLAYALDVVDVGHHVLEAHADHAVVVYDADLYRTAVARAPARLAASTPIFAFTDFVEWHDPSLFCGYYSIFAGTFGIFAPART